MNSPNKEHFSPFVTKRSFVSQRKTPDHFDFQIDLWSQMTTFSDKCTKRSFLNKALKGTDDLKAKFGTHRSFLN